MATSETQVHPSMQLSTFRSPLLEHKKKHTMVGNVVRYKLCREFPLTMCW